MQGGEGGAGPAEAASLRPELGHLHLPASDRWGWRETAEGAEPGAGEEGGGATGRGIFVVIGYASTPQLFRSLCLEKISNWLIDDSLSLSPKNIGKFPRLPLVLQVRADQAEREVKRLREEVGRLENGRGRRKRRSHGENEELRQGQD